MTLIQVQKIALSLSGRFGGLVLIIWTERHEETIRIISARWATKNEQRLYESYLRGSDD